MEGGGQLSPPSRDRDRSTGRGRADSSKEGCWGKGSSSKDKGYGGKDGSAKAGLTRILLGKEETREEPHIGGGSSVGGDKVTVLVAALSYMQCLKE